MLWLVASAALAADAVYTEVSAEVGLDFVQDGGDLAEAMYGGAAVLDADGNGWPDLYVLGGGGRPDALFLNQGASGQFKPGEAIEAPHYGGGVAVGDFDADGWPDLYITSRGPAAEAPATGKHRLLRNAGDGTFEEWAAIVGVTTTSTDIPDGFGAAFADLDQDGDLDLSVTGWYQGEQPNRMFRNLGGFRFRDATAELGLIEADVLGFVPVVEHFDCDMAPELLWGADKGSSVYYVSDGAGGYRAPVPQPPRLSRLDLMGVAVADYDGDLDLDMFLTGIGTDAGVDGNALLLNQGEHRFFDAAAVAGVDVAGWAWGAVATDIDNDGLLDLFVPNGWDDHPFDEQPSALFHNQGELRWVEVAAAAGMGERYDGRTALTLDYDRDGDEDIALIGYREPLRLYRNDTVGAHWLRVALDTSAVPGLAPDGYGARVFATAGGRTLLRSVHGNPSYLGTSEPVAHFGLGEADRVERLEVWWPDGTRTVLDDVAADQHLTVAASPDDPAFDACAVQVGGDRHDPPVGCACSAGGRVAGWWVLIPVLVGLKRRSNGDIGTGVG